MRVVNFISGFLVGGVVSAILVLLFAPQSGSDLQVQVRSRFDHIVNEGRRAAAVRRAELEARLATLRTA